MSHNQSDPFSDYVGGDFDDFDESQLLERALDMGLDFETARDMIFSGNIASLLSGKAAPSRSAPSQHRNFEDDISALIEEMHMDDELNANAAPFVMPNQSMPAHGAHGGYPNTWPAEAYQSGGSYPGYYPAFNPYDPAGYQSYQPYAYAAQPHSNSMSYYGAYDPAKDVAPAVSAPSMPSLLQPLSQAPSLSDINLGAEDCRYFMTSTCRANHNCPFRHCLAAKSSPAVCESFSRSGRCARPSECTARHASSGSAAPSANVTTAVHSKPTHSILPMCWAHKNGKCKRGMSCPSMHIATPSAAALDEARQRAASTIQPSTEKKKQVVDWATWKSLLDTGLMWDNVEKDWAVITALNHAEIECYQHAKSLAEIFNLSDFQKFESFAKSRGQMWATLRDQLRNVGVTPPPINPGDQ